MNKTLLLILTVALLVVITPFSIAIASDIADAVFFGTVRATNTSAVAPNVSVNLSINSDDWIDNGTLNAAANNMAIRNSTGADTEFMPGYDGNPWIVQFDTVPDNGNIDYTLYTNVTGGKIRYFSDDDGMSVDDDSIGGLPELGDNFTVSISGLFDSTASGNLSSKPGAFLLSGDGSGDINAYIFTTTENTTTKRPLAANQDIFLYWNGAAWVTDLANASYLVGYHSAGIQKGSAGFLFTGMTIPKNSEILSANLTFKANGNRAEVQVNTRIVGLNSDNASVFSTANDLLTRPKTTANVTWDNVVAWTAGTSYGSPEIKSIVQEIIDRPGWVIGSNIGIVWEDFENRSTNANNTYRTSEAWTTNPATAALLTVTYNPNLLITAASVARGERKIDVTANVSAVGIYIDDILKDTVTLITGVPDTSANWTFAQNSVMPYMETANITIDGVLQGSWAWEYSDTFTDLSGQGHDATPSFRTTSSDADVSASLITFKPVSIAKVTDNTSITWPVIMADPPDEPSTAYSENITPGIFFAPFVHTIAEFGASNWSGATTNMLEQLFWYTFAFILIIGVSVLVYFFFADNAKEALFIKIFATAAVMIFFALPGINIYGLYVPLYYVFFATGILMLKKDFGW